MGHDDHNKYNPSAGAHALKDFTFDGHEFLAGEPFPVEDTTDEKTRMLWNAGLIQFGKASKGLAAALAKRSADVKRRDQRAAARAKAREAKQAAAAKDAQPSA